MLAIPFGLAVGLSIGALGAGGSILAIPVLVHVLGLDVHAATTASLAVVGTAAAVGVLPHLRSGRVHLGTGFAFGAAGAVGSVAGTRVNRLTGDDLLLLLFAGLALVMATLIARRAHSTTEASETTEASGEDQATGTGGVGHGRSSIHPWARIALAGTGVGFLTGLFGVGGGFVVVPTLILVLGYPTPHAVGTSLVVIALNAATAMAARLGELAIDWTVVGPFALAGVVGVLLGGAVARRSRPQRLAYALAGMLVVVAGIVGIPAASHLTG